MTKTTCNECKGTGQVAAFGDDWEARQAAGETDDCPWCGATGEVDVLYAVRTHGHNGDHSFSELWDVKTSLDNAKKLARKIMEKERFRNLHNGVPTIQWVEITGPGIEESISLEERDGKLTWHGEAEEPKPAPRQATHMEFRWNVRAYDRDGQRHYYPQGEIKATARKTAERLLAEHPEYVRTVVVDGYEELPDDREFGIKVGARVVRVRGTSIENLIGEVRILSPSPGKPDVLTALVRLEGPGEPGIGHQFVAPIGDLALAPSSGRKGFRPGIDYRATTHLESYAAYEAGMHYSGFSGDGWAVIETATGKVLASHAWRNEALARQDEIEAAAASDAQARAAGIGTDPAHSQSAQDAEARGDVDPADEDDRPVRKVYDFIFDTFATDVPEIVTGTGLTEGRVRTALQKLVAAGLVDSYDVNDEAQGARRRGQYKTLTYQCLETYDSLTKDEATAKFLAEFPITPKAPKGAGRSDTMSQSTIITPEALVDGSESPLDVERPDKAPYHRVRANGKTLAYATQRSDGFMLELYSAGLKAAEKMPARFKKMLDEKNRVRVTPKNEKGARSMMEWLAAKVG